VALWFQQGIQGTTIYEALVRNHGFDGSYSGVRRYLKTLKKADVNASVKLTFKPGESAQVDFGKGPDLVDPETGKPQTTWVFVMTLAWSRHMYAEIVKNQKVVTWLGCHRRAFEFFNGLPSQIRIDNLKSAITKACYYEPEVQRAYEELALGYGFRIDPCPVADPKKKGRVESGVKYIKNNFFPLRNIRNIADGNQQLIQWILGPAGNRIHGTTHEKPLRRFEETEAALLHPLPDVVPELAVWNQCKLHGDCHISLDKCYYSAPHVYINQNLWVKSLEKTVTIFKDHQLVATHPRKFKPGAKSTNPDHYPPEAQAYLMRDPQWCLVQAEKIGPYCRELVEDLFADRVLEKLRAAQGIISFKKKYGAKSVELACKRAIIYLSPKYKTVKSILTQGLEHEPIERQQQLPLDDLYTGQARYIRPLTDMFQ
ncbi:IS21 family transposase, partial [Candidatus Uhrbacteria bacterium]|nr:IS21 family transposase [Candidatus Uhrbacteria bacterium]